MPTIMTVKFQPTIPQFTFDNVSFPVVDQTTRPRGIHVKPDGTKMYISSSSPNDLIFQYTLTTPWDLSTASYDQVDKDVSNQDISPQEVTFNLDGTKVYFVGFSSRRVYQYNLTIPWDLGGTVSLDGSFSLGSTIENFWGTVAFKTDGTKMYVGGNTNNESTTLQQVTLSTPWDVSTGSFDNISFSFANEIPQLVGARALHFSNEGDIMYAGQGGNIFRYTLSPAWDITSATLDKTIDVSAQISSVYGVSVDPTDSIMFAANLIEGPVFQYSK